MLVTCVRIELTASGAVQCSTSCQAKTGKSTLPHRQITGGIVAAELWEYVPIYRLFSPKIVQKDVGDLCRNRTDSSRSGAMQY